MSASIEPVQTGIYGMIREFWGENLGQRLIERIVAAPADHIQAFRWETLRTAYAPLRGLPELQRGRLRPVFAVNAADEILNRGEDKIRSAVPVLLLFAHEVVMDPLSLDVASYNTNERRAVLEWLLQVKPLYDDGAIHFKPVTSSKRHPSRSLAYRDPELIARVVALRDPFVADFVSRYAGHYRGDPKEVEFEIVSLLLRDATSHFDFHRLYGSRAHKLVRTAAEQVILKRVLGDVSPYVDTRELTLSSLMHLAVPAFKPDVRSLVAVRRSGEAFAEWRLSLGNAVNRLDLASIQDTSRLAEIIENLRGELAPLAERVEKASRRSPALAALRTGTKGFALSAIAAGAGLSIGGSPVSALVGAGATKTVEGAIEYFKAREARRKDKAVLDLVLSFSSEQPPEA
jgi:hypothetical protein